ncbi:response regulator transcription factor [Longirhabdus pacifica]|uniref:response regulator transcription factor n=1 Tax=Longirhabdus pacifica TaxID=2305227 RepID=UPI0010091FB5|nr:response regulator transcription factor [Longirhabdus pacifica]
MYNVFIVDDEPIIVEGMKSIIHWEEYGLNIIGFAHNGKQALQALRSLQGEECHILITDIMMPEMNGLQLIQSIKQLYPEMKFILLSGYQEFDYVKQGITLGVENYLLKPIDEEELATTLQQTTQHLKKSVQRQDDRNVLRDNTVWRWLNKDVDRKQLEERLSLYRIQQSLPQVTVAIMEADFTIPLTSDTLFEFRDALEIKTNSLCIIAPHQYFIFVWFGHNREEVKQDVMYVEEQMKAKEEVHDFFITLGNTVMEEEQVFHSFEQIQKLRKARFALTAETNVITEKFAGHYFLSSDQSVGLNVNLEPIIGHALHYEYEAVEQSIHEMYDQIFDENVSMDTCNIVRGLTIEILSRLHAELGSKQHHFMSLSTMVSHLMTVKTKEQLKQQLLQYVQQMMREQEEQEGKMSPIIQSVIHYISNNLHEELSLKTLSQRFHVNTNYLGQLFQREVGSVFSEYVNHMRIEKAKSLLLQPQYKVGEIGKMVGYSDPTYFYKQFKKSIGCTPKEWRSAKFA